MFWLKACPKCQGDLYKGEDAFGSYIACMQCSRYLTQAEEAKLLLATAGPNLKEAVAGQKTKAAA